MTIDDWMSVLLLGSIYFMPTIVAVWQRSAAWPLVFVINLFFGWTLIGWVAGIVIAGSAPDKKQLARQQKVNQARDEFYLREQEKFAATK